MPAIPKLDVILAAVLALLAPFAVLAGRRGMREGKQEASTLHLQRAGEQVRPVAELPIHASPFQDSPNHIVEPVTDNIEGQLLSLG